MTNTCNGYVTMEFNQTVGGNTGQKENMVKFIKKELETEAETVIEQKNNCGRGTDVEYIECKPDIRNICKIDSGNSIGKDKDVERSGRESEDMESNTRMRRSVRKAKRKVDSNFEYFKTKKHTRNNIEETNFLPSKHKRLKKRNQDSKTDKQDFTAVEKIQTANSEQVDKDLVQTTNSKQIVVDDDGDQTANSEDVGVDDYGNETINSREGDDSDGDQTINLREDAVDNDGIQTSREDAVDDNGDQTSRKDAVNDDREENFEVEVKKKILDTVGITETDQNTKANVSASDITDQILDRETKGMKCLKCKLGFSNRNEYISHMKELHKDYVPCEHCDTYYKTKSTMMKHFRKTHSVKTNGSASKQKRPTYQCTYDGCLKEFKDKWGRTKHVNAVHLNIRKHVCEHCGFRFKNSWHLKMHVSSVHTKDISRINPSRSYADRPFRYKCSYEGCLKQFKDKWEEKKHVNAVHLNIRKYQCEFCGYRAKTFNALKVHLLAIHTKESEKKVYECDVCGKSFGKRNSLYYHKTLHSDTKHYICEFENCGKSFRLKDGLRKHERIHTGFKPYQCEVCEERFSRKIYLETHMYKHTGLKKFVCEICKKFFSQKGNLTVHMLLHDQERPVYKCQKCSYTSNFKSNLTKHLQQH
ncbi:zinc finger protein 729-like [Mercenaria mercenaria]|uniref:zinc finger protein 729-like n=1 Tax=Mercenaria mercenaria TaxID=6596 RepID=UPI00234E5BDB|nr:zinc finger protein 729-like [Mercenaria mercenaria]